MLHSISLDLLDLTPLELLKGDELLAFSREFSDYLFFLAVLAHLCMILYLSFKFLDYLKHCLSPVSFLQDP